MPTLLLDMIDKSSPGQIGAYILLKWGQINENIIMKIKQVFSDNGQWEHIRTAFSSQEEKRPMMKI